MAEKNFSLSQATLQEMAKNLLTLAQQRGATSAEIEVSEGQGQTVSVRLDEIENIEYNQDKGVGITVYLGQKKGHASTSDFSSKALVDTVQAAIDIACHTAEDPCSGLADPQLLATDFPDLSLFHPWVISVEEAIALAKRCERAALGVDKRLTNSEGASVSTQVSQFVYANSNGFMQCHQGSRQSVSAAVVAQQEQDMQRDYWYSSTRHPDDLETPEQVGQRAGVRAVRRLGAKRVKTGEYPVLFEAPVASSLINHIISAISGGSLYRKSSFLLDSLGTPITASCVNIDEDPFILRGLASGSFDNDGVATCARRLIDNGVLQGYMLGCYSARKLGMQTTGNAGGAHNLIVRSTGESFSALLKTMGKGLLITELLGQGVNLVTGDYSRGAVGFWIENGEIAYPVEEITIAGNLRQMLKNIQAIGCDHLIRGSVQMGSLLIASMMVAGED